VTVTRRKDDLYTLGDLWPQVSKSLLSTTVYERVNEAMRWSFLRNQVGAHFNEWATSLSVADAKRFAASVIGLLGSVYCMQQCQTWVRRVGGAWSCTCGKTTFARLESAAVSTKVR
jgi:hypothetical protein